MYGVPVCAPDREMAGAILEYLGGLSTDTIRATYYDTALTRKYTRDNESVKSLDILFNNLVIDIGFAYNFGNIRSTLTNALATGGTLASTVASIKKSAENSIKETIKAYAELN